MLNSLKKAQTESPEAFATAFDDVNKRLGARNAKNVIVPKTVELQHKFMDDGGAAFCLELITSQTEAKRAWTALANLAGNPQINLKLIQIPGLLDAAVKDTNALVLLGNLAAIDANKMRLATQPGLFEAADDALFEGGEVARSAKVLLDQLQEQRMRISMMMTQAVVPATPVMGAPESEAGMSIQLAMMQQQMAQQQQMFQQQMMQQQQQMMMMMQAQGQKQQPTTVVVNNRSGGGGNDCCCGLCALWLCLTCGVCGPCDDGYNDDCCC